MIIFRCGISRMVEEDLHPSPSGARAASAHGYDFYSNCHCYEERLDSSCSLHRCVELRKLARYEEQLEAEVRALRSMRHEILNSRGPGFHSGQSRTTPSTAESTRRHFAGSNILQVHRHFIRMGIAFRSHEVAHGSWVWGARAVFMGLLCSRRCSVAMWRQNTAGCWLRAARVGPHAGRVPCDRLYPGFLDAANHLVAAARRGRWTITKHDRNYLRKYVVQ